MSAYGEVLLDAAPVVLIVDDEPIARSVVEGHLASIGAVTNSVASVDEALAHLHREGPPDVIVCDVMMPLRDGFDLCAAVRSDPRTAIVPFVFLTAMGDAEARLRALDAGADELLTKPVDELELLARIRSATALSRLRARLAGRERFVAVLDAVGEGVVTLDVGGRVVDANGTAERLLGLTPDGGMALDDALSAFERLRLEPEGADGRYGVLRRDAVGEGEELFLGVRQRPVRGGGEVAHVITVRDVTGEERARSAGELVVNSIVHKFRTPLTGLVGAVEVLGRTDLSPAQRSLVGIVESSTRRLDGSLRRVLATVDREATGAARTPVVLPVGDTTVLAALVGPETRPLVDDATVALTHDVTVYAEVVAVVLEELVANARAAAPSGRVTVALRGTAETVEVVVSDDGPGVPPEDLDRLFGDFFQVDRSGQAEGMGLGLPLVRRALARCGGRLCVESEPGRRTVFTATMPALAAPEDGEPRPVEG